MTDPTNLRARAEALLKSAPSFAEYHREKTGYRGASQEFHDLALGFITATGDALRDLLAALPPACACDGGLFGAGPGDHAIGCPARPPEAPGERRPVAGWRETRPGLWHLDLGPFDATAETPAHNAYRPATTWGVAGKRLGAIPGTQLDAAKLAAEDAADALLCAGRRALGRVA